MESRQKARFMLLAVKYAIYWSDITSNLKPVQTVFSMKANKNWREDTLAMQTESVAFVWQH